MAAPSRGEIWLIDFDPTRGYGPAGRRPALIISDDRLNRGRAGFVYVIPLTTQERGLPTHVPVSAPEGGARTPSFVKCEDLRSVSTDRLIEGPWGAISLATLAAVEERIRLLLGL